MTCCTVRLRRRLIDDDHDRPLRVELDLHPVSSVVVQLVARRGTEVLATLGTWGPLRGWDLSAAGCAERRLRAVLPAVVARAASRRGEAWQPHGAPQGVLRRDGNRMTARTWSDG